MVVHRMDQTLKRGDWGVQQIAARFRAHGWQVDDVQDAPFGQVMDFDLVVESPLGAVLTVEVKADTHWDRIYIEEYSTLYDKPAPDGSLGTPGCLLYSQADVLAYYFVRRGFAVMVPMRELQAWIGRRLADFEAKVTLDRGLRGQQRRAQGRPVPVRTIWDEVPGVYLLRDLPIQEERRAA